MTKPSLEKRETTLNLRTTASIKKMAEALSVAEERSLANVIERLVRAEFDRRGMLLEPDTKRKKKAP